MKRSLSPDPRAMRGRRGEERAASHLRQLGYRVIERNFQCGVGELDIVAMDERTLVFVEVRTRADARYGTALEAVGPAKQRQIARVASMYLAKRRPRFEACRFDVIGITGDHLEHIRDAFQVDLYPVG